MKKILLIFLILINYLLKSQVFDFQVINQEQGLPSSVVTSIFQDSRNIIWIGTDGAGLVSFDGNNYKIFDENKGLAGGFIKDIIEDDNNKLIIATNFNGLSIFDGRTFIKLDSVNNKPIKSASFSKLIKGKDGIYCFGDYEIIVIPKNYDAKIIYTHSNSFGTINSLSFDVNENLLIGSSKGLFNLANNEIKRVLPLQLDGQILVAKNNLNEIIVASSKGTIYKLENAKTNKELILNKIIDLPQPFEPNKLFISKRGAIWLSDSMNQGLLLINGLNISKFNKTNGFNGENVLCFMQDNARNLYIGTEGFGLFKTGPQLFVSYSNIPILDNQMIFSVFKEHKDLYIGIRKDGIYKFSESENGQYLLEKSFKNEIGANVIFKNNFNEILASCKNGLFKIENDKLTTINTPFLPIDAKGIVSIKQDSKNRYFIGGYGSGLTITDNNLNVIKAFYHETLNNCDYVYTIDQFENNKWYIGTNNGLFILTETSLNKFELSKNLIEGVTSISTKDKFGNYWFAGSGFIYTIGKNGIKKFDKKNGLTSILIYTLLADKNGNLWSGSNLGIDKIEVNEKSEIISVKNYNSKNGFKGLETNTRAQFIDDEGNLYFGTVKGISKCITSYSLKKSDSIPSITLNDIKISNKTINWLTEQSKNKWINVPENDHEFKTEENHLTFQFNLINPPSNDIYYYSYKLEGADEDWSNPTQLKEISYSNLRSGKYNFKIRLVTISGDVLNSETNFNFSIKTPFYLTWWFILFIIILIISLFYSLLQKTKTHKKEFVQINSNKKVNNTNIKFYTLYLGLVIIITELILEIFKIREESQLFRNLVFGVICLTVFFLSGFVNVIYNFLYPILVTIFISFFAFIAFHIYTKPLEIANFGEFFLVLFFSFSLFKKTQHFWSFIALICLFIFSLFFSDVTTLKSIISLITLAAVMLLMNLVRIISNRNNKEKLLFANNIINNGNSLVLATNKFGEVSYCSENITKILGYSPNEVLGMKFWNLTQDKDFEYTDYSTKFIKDRVYVRKLKCKNGEYKFIQWTDTKYSEDLYVGIGQDVTEQIKAQEQYKNIVENATDIIFEADSNGKFTFVNEVIKNSFGFKQEDLIGKHFTSIVRTDYKLKVARFYYKLEKNKNDFNILEFPISNIDNKEFWVSQKVNVKRDENGEILNYSAIVRDITPIKNAELANLKRQEKTNKYNLVLNQLTTNPNSYQLTYDEIIRNILFKSAEVLEIDRLSVWKHFDEKIVCEKVFSKSSNSFDEGEVLLEADIPKYFKALIKGGTIIANDVCENPITSDFCNNQNNDIKSLLDVPIFTNGAIRGLICCEMTESYKEWDSDDVNFARSIADIISISIETQRRKTAEVAIKESERNFRLLNETIDDVFWLFDIEKSTIIYISPSSKKVLGVEPKEFYTTNNYWTNYILDIDKPMILEAHNKLITDSYYEVEYRINTESGIKWIFEKSFAIKDENGKLTKNSGICTDITEKKKTEIQLKQLSIVAEKTSNGILIADKDGKALWANQSYLDLFEVPITNLIGKRPRDLFGNNNNELLQKMEVLNGNNFTEEIEAITYTGKTIWVELNSTVIKNEGDEVVQQIEVLTDITEKIKNKNQLEQYSKDLEYQSSFQQKIINSYTLRDLITETLSFIHSKTPGCVQISLFNYDFRKNIYTGYTYNNNKFSKALLNANDTRSFKTLVKGEIYIEHNLPLLEPKNNFDIEEINNGINSYIILPILKNDELIGTLNIGLNHVFNLAESEINILKSFTDLLSITLQQLELKNELYEKNKDNIDSLTYAQNIQNTILPEIKSMQSTFNDVCLYFKPRDIVSGDFYWAKEIGDLTFIAVADCTGHGVPGAFLTLIGSRILEQIVTIEKITNPSEILTKLDEQIYLSLNSKANDIIRDGMEIALCVIDKQNKKLNYAGAGLGILYFKNGEEFYIKGQRKSIGDYRHDDFSFETISIDYIGDETFYMATDGYQDQLGGANYKRFSKKRTIELLKEIISLPSNEKETLLDKEIKEYIGKNNQTDDITVLGFKLN